MIATMQEKLKGKKSYNKEVNRPRMYMYHLPSSEIQYIITASARHQILLLQSSMHESFFLSSQLYIKLSLLEKSL